MSVRRLAEESVQPSSFAFNSAIQGEVAKWMKKYPAGREQSAVIPLLMLAQEQEGWVSKAAIEHVAGMLDMPKIRVLEVATFYTQFQLNPVGARAHIQVCGTTPCMLRGSEELIKVCKKHIHEEPFHTNFDGTMSWEEVECQGACVNAPMVVIFKDTYEDLTPQRLEEIIHAFEKGKGDQIKPGPRNGRVYSAAVSGATTLTDVDAIMRKPGAKLPAAGKAKSAAAGKVAAPSNAAKPKTAAEETSAALKGPSAKKVPAKAEAAASAEPAPKTTAPKRGLTKAGTAAGGGKGRGSAAASAPGDAASFMGSGKAAKAGSAKTAFVKPLAAKSVKAADAKPASAAATKEAVQALDDKNRPAAVKRPAKPDDLQLISGVGPKIEGILHSLGIFTFAQVASWKKAEREWVDGYLRFKGRIEREDWVKQAKALAKGGRDEYVRVFGKEPR